MIGGRAARARVAATAFLVVAALGGCGSERQAGTPAAIIPGGGSPIARADSPRGCVSLGNDRAMRTAGEAIDGWVIGRDDAGGRLIRLADRLDELASEDDTDAGVGRALSGGSKALRRAARTGPRGRAVPALSSALDVMGRRLQRRCRFSLG